jgi:two-component system cell cycle response regulator CpdR
LDINPHLRAWVYTVYLDKGRELGMANILLAEDDESLRRFLAAALVKAGHEVVDFGDGTAAYECLRQGRVVVFVNDIFYAGFEGIEKPKRAADLDWARN